MSTSLDDNPGMDVSSPDTAASQVITIAHTSSSFTIICYVICVQVYGSYLSYCKKNNMNFVTDAHNGKYAIEQLCDTMRQNKLCYMKN